MYTKFLLYVWVAGSEIEFHGTANYVAAARKLRT